MHAFESLSEAEIKEAYGENKIFQNLEWPKLTNFEFKKSYWTFQTFFEINNPVIIMQI